MSIKDIIKRKYEEIKRENQYKKNANDAIEKKTKAEYYRAKEKQELLYARQKARIETQSKIREYKGKYKPQKPSGNSFSGLGGGSMFPSSGGSMFPSSGGSSIMPGILFGGEKKSTGKKHKSKPKKQHKKVTKRKKRSSGNRVIIIRS